MHASILDKRFIIKAIPVAGRRPIELNSIMKPHPLSYMELPFDPEYSLYNNRMTPERLNNVTDDEQYWAVRQRVAFEIRVSSVKFLARSRKICKPSVCP